jgi:hypothetical protein
MELRGAVRELVVTGRRGRPDLLTDASAYLAGIELYL